MFKIDRSFLFPRVGFLQASEQVVVAGEEEGRGCLHLQVYTKYGKFVRSTELDAQRIYIVRGLAVTMEGGIFVALEDKHGHAKVLVV